MERWAELIDVLWGLIQEHWAEVVFSAISLTIGLWWGRRRAIREWRRKEFFDRLNVSLNMIVGNQLIFRTILETNCGYVFLNKVAAQMALEAARKTTEEDPILPLNQEDSWYLLNAVLNEVAERFALGEIYRDVAAASPQQSQPPISVDYLLCLTCERAGDLRTRKIRAMMIRKELLTNLPEETLRVEHPRMQTRAKTLQAMAKAYQDVQRKHQFIELQLTLPSLAPAAEPSTQVAVSN